MTVPFDTSVVCPVFIGRTAALVSFEHVFEQVTNGQGQTVLISGEARIGKSRFVAEVRARIKQHQVVILQGACFEQDRTLPFAPLLDMLRTLLIANSHDNCLLALSPFAPELIKLLPELALWLPGVTPTPALEPEQEKRRLFVALTSLSRSPTPNPCCSSSKMCIGATTPAWSSCTSWYATVALIHSCWY